MRHFYVDYENVQSVGLYGLDELTDQDKVTILYSTHADSMKIDIVKPAPKQTDYDIAVAELRALFNEYNQGKYKRI